MQLKWYLERWLKHSPGIENTIWTSQSKSSLVLKCDSAINESVMKHPQNVLSTGKNKWPWKNCDWTLTLTRISLAKKIWDLQYTVYILIMEAVVAF